MQCLSPLVTHLIPVLLFIFCLLQFDPDPSEVEQRLMAAIAPNNVEQAPSRSITSGPSVSGSFTSGSTAAATTATTTTKLSKAEKKRRRERERAKEREKEKEQRSSDLSCQSSRESDIVEEDVEPSSLSQPKQSREGEDQVGRGCLEYLVLQGYNVFLVACTVHEYA